jgi:uncharacterized protein YwbE
MKRAAGSGIKSWEPADELWEQVKEFIPQRGRKQNLPAKTRGWEWQSVDGCMVKAVGIKSHESGKKGRKRSVAVESSGLPVGIVENGSNRHDVKLLEETVQSIITAHPKGMHVCLDGGMQVRKNSWPETHCYSLL